MRPTIGLFLDRLYDSYNYICWINAVKLAEKRGINLICFSGGAIKVSYYRDSERNFIYDLVTPENIDGIISLSGSIGNSISAEELKEFYKRFSPIPLVSIGIQVPGLPSIIVNNENGMFNSVTHLITKHKRKRIAFIKGSDNNPEAVDRLTGYTRALKDHGIPYDPELVLPGNFDRYDGRKAMELLLNERKIGFDAVVGANDLTTIYAMHTLIERGIKVPEEVSVSGFDDIDECRKVSPLLTTVKQPLEQMITEAFTLVLGCIEGKLMPEVTKVDSVFIARSSCGCPGEKESPAEVCPSYESEEKFIELSKINENIIGSFNEETIKELVQIEFPNLGITGYSIALFESPENKGQAKIYLASKDLPIPNVSGGCLFQSCELLPGGLKRLKNRFSYMLMPLYFKKRHFGFILFHIDSLNRFVYETITGQLSSALQGATLLEDLRRYADSLEDKVKSRTRQLEEANAEKTKFFINIAHETRTPLTLIKNYMDKYIKNPGNLQDLNIVRRNINLLLQNMLNFLDVEKLRRGEIIYDHSQAMDLTKLLENKVALFQVPAAKKSIALNVDLAPGCRIMADPFAIDRIINNLLDNAIKYTPPNGQISIRSTNEGTTICLKIEDSGIGIPKDEIESVFQPYHRLSHYKTGIQGMGMGLYITRQLLMSMGAALEIQSELEAGTSFSITFKTAPADLKTEELPVMNEELFIPITSVSEEDVKPGKENIFLVEDNPEMLFFLKSMLKPAYNVFTAKNGREVIAMIRDIPLPGLIISDVMMDEMDGYTFQKKLMQQEKFKDIPFIFLTAKTGKSETLRGFSEGVIDYIYKPFSFEELASKISIIFRLNKQVEEKQIKIVEKQVKEYSKRYFNKESDEARFKRLCVTYKITSSQKRVLALLLEGFIYKEIAYKLNLAVKTVEFHTNNIYKQCSVSDKLELTELFFAPPG